MSPQLLGNVLQSLPRPTDENLLVGNDTFDDASVYRLSDELAIVQSVDIFTPVVDDPYDFGQIAAANALSDLYAMGARPLTALSILGFPSTQLPEEIMAAILRGGVEKAKEAGIDVAGGHAIDDKEPKFGLAVTGVIKPDRIVKNAGARPGDRLVLTKPLGIGILTTALKRGLLSEAEIGRVTSVMAGLNAGACRAMQRVGVSAATDVTGFGLLGHLTEVLRASEVGARVVFEDLPVIEGVLDLLHDGVCPGGTKRNLSHFDTGVTWKIPEVDHLLVADAQTSGGLLISVPEASLESLLSELEAEGVETRAVIGEITPERGIQVT